MLSGEKMPHCPKCGKETVEDAEFCMFCGTQIWRKTLGKKKEINDGLVVSCTLLITASTYLIILATQQLLFIEYQRLEYEVLFMVSAIGAVFAFVSGNVAGVWTLTAKKYRFALYGNAVVLVGCSIAFVTLLIETMEATTDINEIMEATTAWWFPLILSIISLYLVVVEKKRVSQ
jgi:hypothetical protein